MTIAALALTGARVVRLSTLTAVAAVMVCLVALQAFGATYERSVARVVTQADVASSELVVAIQHQRDLGRRCSSTPTLTDVVLYQANGSAEVAVITFDQALERSAAGAGWVRGYCV